MLKRFLLRTESICIVVIYVGKCLVLNLLFRAFFLDFAGSGSFYFYFTFIKVPLSTEQIRETAAIPASGSQRGSFTHGAGHFYSYFPIAKGSLLAPSSLERDHMSAGLTHSLRTKITALFKTTTFSGSPLMKV